MSGKPRFCRDCEHYRDPPEAVGVHAEAHTCIAFGWSPKPDRVACRVPAAVKNVVVQLDGWRPIP